MQAEIVGVVGHVKQYGLDTDPKGTIQAQFFYPFMQIPEKVMPLVAKSVAVVLRTQGDPTAVMGQVRETVKEIDPRQVVYNVQTMDDVVATSYAARRLTMILLGVFAGLALALGLRRNLWRDFLPGWTAHAGNRHPHGAGSATSRHPASGARRGSEDGADRSGDRHRRVVGLTRLMAKQLFGVSAHDPLTYAGVAALLMLVAIAACYIPARRAVRVDPMTSLRRE